MGRSRRAITLTVFFLALAIGFPSMLRAQEISTPPTPAAAQRMTAIGQLGGLVNTVALEPDNATLAGEGSSLIRLQGDRVIARADLGRGTIQEIAGSYPNRYVLTEQGVVIMQGASGALPQEVAFVPGGGQALAVYDNETVLIAAREVGLRLVSVEEAREFAAIPLDGAAVDVAVSSDGQTAYVAAGEAGIHLVDLTTLSVMATFPVQPAQTITLDGTMLIVNRGNALLRIAPETGAVVDGYAPMSGARRVVLDGQYAYVADVHSGLKIFYITNYESVIQVYGETEREAYDIVVSDRYIFVAAGDEGVRVLDGLRPYAPTEIATISLSGPASGMVLSEGRLFVAMGEAGLAVLNVVSPTSARLVNEIPLEGLAHGVVTHAGFAYVATGEAGLSMVSIANPGEEFLMNTIPLEGEALDVAVRRDIILVAAGEAGLHAVDVVRTSEPVLRDTLAPLEGAPGFRSVVATDKRAYVADGEGFVVIDLAETDQMSILAREPFPTQGIVLEDIYVLAVGGSQLSIYDARATAEPVHVMTYHAIEEIANVAVRGSSYYLTNAGDGPELVVLDYPREVALYGDQGHTLQARPLATGALVAGGYRGAFRLRSGDDGALALESAYSPFAEITRLNLAENNQLLTGGSDGLSVVDVSDATLPQSVARAAAGMSVQDLALHGDQLAVAAYEDGVALFIHGAPWLPELLMQAETDGPAMGVDIDENYVYVADESGVLDVFSRYDLSRMTRIVLPAGANGLTRRGSLGYVPLDDGSLAVVDLTDPSGGVQRLGAFPVSRPTALIAGPDATRVFAMADDMMQVLDITDPAAIQEETLYPLVETATHGALQETQLFVMTPGTGAHIYDVTRPDAPTPLGWVSAGGETILPHGDVIYVAYGDGGLGVVANTTQAQNPVAMLLTEPVHAIALADGRLVAAGDALTVWDITQSGAPAMLGQVDLPASARTIAPAWGGQVIVGADSSLVAILVDATGQPTLTGSVPVSSEVNHLAVVGAHAYAGMHDGGLLVVDVASPSDPTPLFTILSAMGRYVQSLLPLNETRLMVSWEAGLEILDVGAFSASPPRMLTVTPTGGVNARDVAVEGNLAAVALGEDGAVLLDVSNPSLPDVLGRADTPGSAERVAFGGSALFVADGLCGVRAFGLQDPAAPGEVGFWVNGYAGDVAVDAAERVHVADANELFVLEFHPSDPPALPPVPQMPSPGDGQDGAPLAPVLRWGPPYSPCDPLTYSVYFGASDDPPHMGQIIGEPMLALSALTPLQTYYWRIEVTDRQGDRVSGPTWQFVTGEGEAGSHMPPAPPPFDETLREHLVLVLAFILALILLAAIWSLRRGRQRRAERD